MKNESTTALAPATALAKFVANDPFFLMANRFNNAIARRVLGLLKASGFADGNELDDWFNKVTELGEAVPIDITETDDQVVVKAKVPGFTEKDIDVRVEPQRLYIAGKREKSSEEKKGRSVYSEWSSNEMYREFELPAEIDQDKVKADVANGVLEIRMPKRQKAKKIELAKKAAA